MIAQYMFLRECSNPYCDTRSLTSRTAKGGCQSNTGNRHHKHLYSARRTLAVGALNELSIHNMNLHHGNNCPLKHGFSVEALHALSHTSLSGSVVQFPNTYIDISEATDEPATYFSRELNIPAITALPRIRTLLLKFSGLLQTLSTFTLRTFPRDHPTAERAATMHLGPSRSQINTCPPAGSTTGPHR